MSLDGIHVIAVSFDRLALAMVYALAIGALWLAPPSSPKDKVRRAVMLSTMVAITLVAASIELLLRTAVMADVTLFQAWNFIPKVLTHSDYGTYWQGRVIAWGVLLIMTISIYRKGWSLILSLGLLFAALVSSLLVSVTSHAGDEGLWSIANLMNWLHLVSTSMWGGSVVLYALLVLPELRRDSASEQTTIAAERLSTLATIALALVLVSGVFNTWRQLGAWSDLWLTEYGRVLLIKLSLVAIMMTIGALNRFLFVPRLVAWHRNDREHWGAPSNRFVQILRLDGLIFVAVLITAVVLGMQAPPAHDRSENLSFVQKPAKLVVKVL